VCARAPGCVCVRARVCAFVWVRLCARACVSIGVDSGGQPGHAPPIIKMGKPLFCPSNNQTRICNFFYLKKIKHERKQKQRQRKKNTKKREYIFNEGCHFLKSCNMLMTKKRSSEILENRRGFFQIFCRMLSENIFFPKIFAPHPIFVTQIYASNIYDKSTPVCVRAYFKIRRIYNCTKHANRPIDNATTVRTFDTAHFDFKTAQIVTNCTLEYAMVCACVRARMCVGWDKLFTMFMASIRDSIIGQLFARSGGSLVQTNRRIGRKYCRLSIQTE